MCGGSYDLAKIHKIIGMVHGTVGTVCRTQKARIWFLLIVRLNSAGQASQRPTASDPSDII